MKVLVGYATRHGSTGGVAGRIAGRLQERGLTVDVRELRGTEDATDYDAIVVGSAVYSRAWLPPAVEFAHRNMDVLGDRPVWTFSVGRLSGQRGVLRRLSWPDTAALEDLELELHPRSHQFFAGAIDRGRLSRFERLVFWLAGGRYGDFRDWAQVESWAQAVAEDLSRPPVQRP